MNFNEIAQWTGVAAVLIATIAATIRGLIRLIRRVSRDNDNATPGCSCGCSGCDLADQCGSEATTDGNVDQPGRTQRR